MFKKVQLRWRRILGDEAMIDSWGLGWRACQSLTRLQKPCHGRKLHDGGSNIGNMPVTLYPRDNEVVIGPAQRVLFVKNETVMCS